MPLILRNNSITMCSEAKFIRSVGEYQVKWSRSIAKGVAFFLLIAITLLFARMTPAAIMLSAAAVNNNKTPATQYSEQWLLANPQRVSGLLEEGKITLSQVPNPHHGGGGCISCHTGNATPAQTQLRGNPDQTCADCHDSLSAHSYIHPSGMRPSASISKNMSKIFRRATKKAGGEVSCVVCHDAPVQCLPERKQEYALNPMFLRGGPYRSRTGMCYQCHDRKSYQRLNPHDQIAEDGALLKDRCALCHADIDRLDDAQNITEVDFNVQGNLSGMCTGCHPWRPHPGGMFDFTFSGKSKKGPDHLVKPPEAIKRFMQKRMQENDIVLPLDPNTGKLFCGTCHNPHEKGVIKVDAAAHGADEFKRLRSQNICVQCHDK